MDRVIILFEDSISYKYTMEPQSIYMLVGLPASGKSTFATTLATERNCVILNRDTIGCSISQLLPLLEKNIREGKNVILDNTNLTKSTRKLFVDFANKSRVNIHAIYIDDTVENCVIKCLNRLYQKNKTIDFDNIDDLQPVVLFKSRKELEIPNIQEGFSSFVRYKGVVLSFEAHRQKCVFLDVDGTLRKTDDLPYKYPTNPNEVVLLFDKQLMYDTLMSYVNNGYMLCGVSNQSGIGKGNVSMDTVVDCNNRVLELLGLEFPIIFCPHNSFPIKCYCRKPQSGLFLSMIFRHEINPALSIMVGDRTEDKTSATRLKMTYMTPETFFSP